MRTEVLEVADEILGETTPDGMLDRAKYEAFVLALAKVMFTDGFYAGGGVLLTPEEAEQIFTDAPETSVMEKDFVKND